MEIMQLQPSRWPMPLVRRAVVLGISLALSAGHGSAQAPIFLARTTSSGATASLAAGRTPSAGSKGMLTLRSMRVASSGPEGSMMHFGPNSEFAMGTDSAGNFIVQQASNPAAPLLSLDDQDTLHIGSSHVQALSIDTAGGISVAGVRQWRLMFAEDFTSVQTSGWSRPEATQCAGVQMLGGFCKFSNTEVNKTFSGLPPHKQLRIVATYHFIDSWQGETGYMKVSVGQEKDLVTVWSEQHAQENSKNGLNLCGNGETPEGKFSASIDVMVPHNTDTLSVSFGSTMDDVDPCDQSWGVSGVEVYARS
mmetsp:Transcript_64686/g.122693  ORF Transcript_64686/g.122693 Transcript_64686/m.122693 type:complete len:307 (+) Transcript_64686:101-1021(+)